MPGWTQPEPVSSDQLDRPTRSIRPTATTSATLIETSQDLKSGPILPDF
jgi:hypothetical protein